MKIGSILLGNRRNVTPIFVGSYGNHLTRGIYAFQVDVDTGEFIKKAFFKSENNPILKTHSIRLKISVQNLQ